MKRLSVLIPDADAWACLLVAHCLADSGEVTLHGLSRRETTPNRHSKLFASFETLRDNVEIDQWSKAIDEIVTKRSIDIVLPISGFAIRSLSERRGTLNWASKLVQLPDPHVFDLATNKATLANFMKAHDIACPSTTIVNTGEPARLPLSDLSFPVLAKPPTSTAGDGIRVFENVADLERFLATCPLGQSWVLQDFVEGYDVCVNVLCREGETIASTVQREIQASSTPFQPTLGIDVTEDPLATALAQKLIRKLGWTGVANIDMRFDAKRKTPLVLEINGRYWGSLLASLNAGVNFPLLSCETSLGTTRSNCEPKTARYFYGSNRHLLLSLAGGGKYHIRPSETLLRYFIRDPIPFIVQFASARTERARKRLQFDH